jgi:hypothetical protein
MKRTLAAAAVFGLVILGSPAPAHADLPEVCALEVVCVHVDPNGNIIDDATGAAIGRALDSLPAPVITTQTTTAPAPAPVTRTTTRTNTATRTATATVTEAPVTQTATQTQTVIPTRQSATPSATLATPTGPVESDIGIIPDDPDKAAATGTLFGLMVGMILGIIGLFVVYRRGQADGEKATLQEFLDDVRGVPQPGSPRHRA